MCVCMSVCMYVCMGNLAGNKMNRISYYKKSVLCNHVFNPTHFSAHPLFTDAFNNSGYLYDAR